MSNPLDEGVAAEELNEVREVKVKLPAELVLQLHYIRMKARRNFSDVMESALRLYLAELFGLNPPVNQESDSEE